MPATIWSRAPTPGRSFRNSFRRATSHGAFVRGYDVTLVSDAHTTDDQTAWGSPPPADVIAHTNTYWTYQSAPGRTAAAIATKDVDFRS